jgi:hypothetical protein
VRVTDTLRLGCHRISGLPSSGSIGLAQGGIQQNTHAHFTRKRIKTEEKNDDDPSSTKDKTRIKTAVMYRKDSFGDESSSCFLSVEPPFPWALGPLWGSLSGLG